MKHTLDYYALKLNANKIKPMPPSDYKSYTNRNMVMKQLKECLLLDDLFKDIEFKKKFEANITISDLMSLFRGNYSSVFYHCSFSKEELLNAVDKDWLSQLVQQYLFENLKSYEDYEESKASEQLLSRVLPLITSDAGEAFIITAVDKQNLVALDKLIFAGACLSTESGIQKVFQKSNYQKIFSHAHYSDTFAPKAFFILLANLSDELVFSMIPHIDKTWLENGMNKEALEKLNQCSRETLDILFKSISPNIKCRYKYIETSLLYAAIDLELENLSLALIEAEADVNYELERKREPTKTPLMLASQKGLVNVMESLISKGCDVNYATYNGMADGWVFLQATSLFYAARYNQLSAVNCLLKHGATIDVPDEDHRSPVLNACREGHVEIVRRFIRAGCKLEFKDSDGYSPLYWAIDRRHWDIVDELVKRGVSLHSFMTICDYSYHPVVEIIKYGPLDLIKQVQARGYSLDERDARTGIFAQTTGLMYAILRNKKEVATYLVNEAKVNLYIEDKDHSTAIFHAIEQRNHYMFQLLVKANPEVLLKPNSRGISALKLMIEQKNCIDEFKQHLGLLTQEHARHILELARNKDHRDSLTLTDKQAALAKALINEDEDAFKQEAINTVLSKEFSLRVSADEQRSSAAQFFVKQGASVTPEHIELAIKQGLKNTLFYLDKALTNEDDYSFLYQSIIKGDSKTVLSILSMNWDELWDEDKLSKMLNRNENLSALMLAAQQPKLDCFFEILNYISDKTNALIKQKNAKGKNILTILTETHPNNPYLKTLLTSPRSRSALLLNAIENQDATETINSLINLGIDVNQVAISGKAGVLISPLLAAVRSNQVETVRVLIKHNAIVTPDIWQAAIELDKNTKDIPILNLLAPTWFTYQDHQDKQVRFNTSDLLDAIKEDNQAIADLYIKYRAGLDYQDDQQRTPLYVAVQNCNLVMVSKLLKAGASKNIKTKGKTVLEQLNAQIAKEESHIKSYQKLIGIRSLIQKLSYSQQLTREQHEAILKLRDLPLEEVIDVLIAEKQTHTGKDLRSTGLRIFDSRNGTARIDSTVTNSNNQYSKALMLS